MSIARWPSLSRRAVHVRSDTDATGTVQPARQIADSAQSLAAALALGSGPARVLSLLTADSSEAEQLLASRSIAHSCVHVDAIHWTGQIDEPTPAQQQPQQQRTHSDRVQHLTRAR